VIKQIVDPAHDLPDTLVATSKSFTGDLPPEKRPGLEIDRIVYALYGLGRGDHDRGGGNR